MALLKILGKKKPQRSTINLIWVLASSQIKFEAYH